MLYTVVCKKFESIYENAYGQGPLILRQKNHEVLMLRRAECSPRHHNFPEIPAQLKRAGISPVRSRSKGLGIGLLGEKVWLLFLPVVEFINFQYHTHIEFN